MTARRTLRAERRWALRDLRRAGCTCNPVIVALDAGTLSRHGPPWARSGALVEHRPGCPLGDTALAANRNGRLPALLAGGPGCAR